MNIADATRAARGEETWLTRRLWLDTGNALAVKPTNSEEGYLIQARGQKMPGRRWQPQAEDVMAEDWQLIEAENVFGGAVGEYQLKERGKRIRIGLEEFEAAVIEKKGLPFCKNCWEFLPEMERTEYYEGGKTTNSRVTVCCENEEKCKRIAQHIRNEIAQEDKKNERDTGKLDRNPRGGGEAGGKAGDTGGAGAAAGADAHAGDRTTRSDTGRKHGRNVHPHNDGA